ncbi:hypothetical protein D3876_19025 [Sphingomonas cavernae]|uniref:Uncharacterized protein n=1 Tax=Sphingomonas cavernae TaxID=2320861 RepID=A0A418W7C4_9SPHN|nr:hypothetical protein D3876_19025 [Sphingomonas cavernae]
MPVVHALIQHRIAHLHRDGGIVLGAEIGIDFGGGVGAPLFQLEVPDLAVAIVQRQRQAVLARLAVRMDAADVAFAIDTEIVVGGQQVTSRDLAHDRGQPPQKEAHRLVVIAINLEGGTVEQVHLVGHAAERDRSGAHVVLQVLQEGARDLGRNQALEMCVAMFVITARVHVAAL